MMCAIVEEERDGDTTCRCDTEHRPGNNRDGPLLADTDRRQSHDPIHHAALALHGARSHPGAGRSDRGTPACGLGRQRHQDRSAGRCRQGPGHGRRKARTGLSEPPPQQAVDDAESQESCRPRGVHAPRRTRRRRGRELSSRREVAPRSRLRRMPDGEPADRLCEHLRVRAGRTVSPASRVRSDRAGDGRVDVDHRTARPGAGAGGGTHRGSGERALRIHRDLHRAARARGDR